MSTNTAVEPAEDAGPTMSVLSAKIVVRGAEIASHDDMTIHGQWLDGVLRVRHLTVVAGARVSGKVFADEIRNHGVIDGTVEANALMLHRGSTLIGEAKCRTLGVQPTNGVQPGGIVRARIDADESQQIDSEVAHDATLTLPFEPEFNAGGLRVVHSN